jgi:CDP-diacylglycerol--glycerol-3-phosphate 3-phosphatidyltransferase
MAKIFSVVSRAGLARLINPVAALLLRAHVSPNAVTVVGTLGVLVGAIGFGARGNLVPGVIIVTLSAFTDLIDGTMARMRGTSSKFGALLDSTMDRISDGAIFASVAYWQATTGQHRAAVAAIICLVTGQVVSYVKARAEGLGLTANVGVAERAERLVLVGVGGLLTGITQLHLHDGLEIALWVLAVLSLITIGQRMTTAYRQARAAEAAAEVPEVAP